MPERLSIVLGDPGLVGLQDVTLGTVVCFGVAFYCRLLFSSSKELEPLTNR